MGERLNIKNLMIEPQRRPERPFDPERDITEEKWQEIEGFLEHLDRGYFWSEFFDGAAKLKLAAPARLQDRLLTPAAFSQLQRLKADCIGEKKWSAAVRLAAQGKILFPERFDKVGIDDEQWEKVIETGQKYYADGSWEAYQDTVMHSRLVSNEKSKKLQLGESLWESNKKMMEGFRSNKLWGAFMELAAQSKILFPERAHELGLDQEAWEEMIKLFRGVYGDKVNIDFINCIFNLRVLAADEAVLTDRGLKLISHKRPAASTDVPPIPSSRQF